MTPHVLSYEATTYLSVPRVEDIGAATGRYSISASRGAEILADLRNQGIEVPSEVIGIASAYATGENDDWDGGQLLTFVRVSVVIDATGIETPGEFDIPEEILTAVYDALDLPGDIDDDFECADDETLDRYLADNPRARAEVEAILPVQAPTP